MIGGLGYSRSSTLRKASRAVSLTLFLVFGAGAAVTLYGSFALSGNGGGTLIFLALPLAFVAWLFFDSFSSSMSRESYFDLGVDAKISHNQSLLDSQINHHERTIEEHSRALESFWLTPGKRRRLREEVSHAQLMIRGLTKLKDGVADPSIYHEDEPG